jgi:hypothetical protein
MVLPGDSLALRLLGEYLMGVARCSLELLMLLLDLGLKGGWWES